MITEIVRFKIGDGLDRDEILKRFESTMHVWAEQDDLIRKYYIFDEATREGGGVYLWKNRAAAQEAHNTAWCDRAETLYGSRPSFTYFETPFVVDNAKP